MTTVAEHEDVRSGGSGQDGEATTVADVVPVPVPAVADETMEGTDRQENDGDVAIEAASVAVSPEQPSDGRGGDDDDDDDDDAPHGPAADDEVAEDEEDVDRDDVAVSDEKDADDKSMEIPPSSSSSNRPPPPSLPARPVKRARTAYFIFADEMRPKVQTENPGEGVAHQARKIGQLWAQVSPEERDRFQRLAAEERRHVAAQVEAYHAANANANANDDQLLEGGDNNGLRRSLPHSPDHLTFPVAKVRKICRLDPDVKNLSREALQLVVKCAELATARLGREAVKVARLQNRRKLLPEDVAHVCTYREPFLFLKDDLRDLVGALAKEKEAASAASAAAASGGMGGPEADGGADSGTGPHSSSTSRRGDAAREAAAAGSKPLTSYFGASATPTTTTMTTTAVPK